MCLPPVPPPVVLCAYCVVVAYLAGVASVHDKFKIK